MRYVAAIALVFLAACSHTPMQLRQEVPPAAFDSPRAPADAALCVTRNAEEYNPLADVTFTASYRPGREPGSYEVIVLNSGQTRAVADVLPTSSGSRIVVFLTPYLVWRELPVRIAKDC